MNRITRELALTVSSDERLFRIGEAAAAGGPDALESAFWPVFTEEPEHRDALLRFCLALVDWEEVATYFTDDSTAPNR